MLETLNLNNQEQPEEEKPWTEYMQCGGEWSERDSSKGIPTEIMKKLDYKSIVYDYAITQTRSREHTLYRRRKE